MISWSSQSSLDLSCPVLSLLLQLPPLLLLLLCCCTTATPPPCICGGVRGGGIKGILKRGCWD